MRTRTRPVLLPLLLALLAALLPLGHRAAAQSDLPPMLDPVDGYAAQTLFTVGETIGGYTPPGVLDGLGATELDSDTIRVFANHELGNDVGYPYAVSDGSGGTFEMTGARISTYDIDKATLEVVDAGLAYDTIYDANGDVATDVSFLGEPYAPAFQEPADAMQAPGFARFCSGVLHEAGQFPTGIVDSIYFAGEEDGGGFNSIGGAEWALDIENNELWAVPEMGRGAWENVSQIETGDEATVAFILSDDTSPFDADGDDQHEAAPLYLYVGDKTPDGNFIERNGLADGQLYVWVSDEGDLVPSDFNGAENSRLGQWAEIDNDPRPAQASQNGSTGYDEYGYPTQSTLFTMAEDLGTFGFSRPEDVSTNPYGQSEIVLASTGVDTYDIQADGNGADTFGTLYTIDTDFSNLDAPTAEVTIVYDGDEDTDRTLRSPDNIEWALDGLIYVQEDKAETDTASGDEFLFGPDATNMAEAGVVRIDPADGSAVRVAQLDRSVVLDASIDPPTDAFDVDAGTTGEWESSGIIDVSPLFDARGGTYFMLDVQAHGIEEQTDTNTDSRINDDDLAEGGQLLLLTSTDADPTVTVDDTTAAVTVTNDSDRQIDGGQVVFEIDGAVEVMVPDGCVLVDTTLTCDVGLIPAGQSAGINPLFVASGVFDATVTVAGTSVTLPAPPISSPVLAAIQISQERFADADTTSDTTSDDGRTFVQVEERDTAAHVVMSRVDVFADSLTGSVLSDVGPLLFTGSDTLTDTTAAEAVRVLGEDGTIYLLGGVDAISGEVESQLAALGYEIIRLQGATRIETAVAIADEQVERLGGDPESVAVARSTSPDDDETTEWADAVSSGAWAARTANPILLTPSDSAHAVTAGWIDSHSDTAVVVVGGENAVAQATADDLADAATRVAGPNRWATAAAIAGNLWPEDPQGYLVASGQAPDGWAYALAGAGLGADIEWPMLLTAGDVLPAETDAQTCAAGDRADTLVLASPADVNGDVRDDVVSDC